MQAHYRKSINIIIILLFVVLIIFLLVNMENHKSNISASSLQATDNSTFQVENQKQTDYRISIPSLSISAPIIQGIDPTNKEKYNQALEDGVAQMIGTPLPGSGQGNTFIYGHSSADQEGKYNQVFAKMDELQFGDVIKLNFDNKEYEYWVTEKKLIEKGDFSVLDQSGEERLTLMTCWPTGTSDRRIVVVAKRR